MTTRPRRTGGEPVADAVAAISLGLGVALTVAPAGMARAIGVEPKVGLLRTIGLIDLVLGPGLFLARPQWPWLIGRAASNPIIAAATMTNARSVRARVLAAGLIGATVVDLRTALRLRAAG